MSSEGVHRDETTSAQTELSPGIVQDEELILREIIYPIHSDDLQGDSIHARAITLDEFRTTGFSTHKVRHTNQEQVTSAINERLAKASPGTEARVLIGVSGLSVAEIRSIRLDSHKQVFVVIDSATDAMPWHASVLFAGNEIKPSLGRQMRNRLMELLIENMLSIAEAFQYNG